MSVYQRCTVHLKSKQDTRPVVTQLCKHMRPSGCSPLLRGVARVLFECRNMFNWFDSLHVNIMKIMTKRSKRVTETQTTRRIT